MDEFDDFGGFDDDDDFVPAEMAAADAHGAEEFADFGDDGFFDENGGGDDGGEMDGFDDDDGDDGNGGGETIWTASAMKGTRAGLLPKVAKLLRQKIRVNRTAFLRQPVRNR